MTGHYEHCFCKGCSDERKRWRQRMNTVMEWVICLWFFAVGMGVMWVIQH